jgi:hypothetical protein
MTPSSRSPPISALRPGLARNAVQICLYRIIATKPASARKILAQGAWRHQGDILSGLAGPAHSVFAISLSRNFWILPVEVFGTSAKTMVRGTL